MINNAKLHISAAYNHLRSLTVSHDNVKRVALAEQELEEAFSMIEEFEKKNKKDKKAEKKEAADGQTD